jgi:hypothetical protein
MREFGPGVVERRLPAVQGLDNGGGLHSGEVECEERSMPGRSIGTAEGRRWVADGEEAAVSVEGGVGDGVANHGGP